jgi:hypothetical protein
MSLNSRLKLLEEDNLLHSDTRIIFDLLLVQAEREAFPKNCPQYWGLPNDKRVPCRLKEGHAGQHEFEWRSSL